MAASAVNPQQDWFEANAPKPTTQASGGDWFEQNAPKPVTLDMSTAVPLSSGVKLDMSTAVPLAGPGEQQPQARGAAIQPVTRATNPNSPWCM